MNEFPPHYFEKHINILNLLCSFEDAHEKWQTSKDAKRNLYTKLTLKTILASPKEPLGSSIRAMRPNTLQQALKYINEENNIRYIEKKFVAPNIKPFHYNNNPNQQFPFQQKPNFNRQHRQNTANNPIPQFYGQTVVRKQHNS